MKNVSDNYVIQCQNTCLNEVFASNAKNKEDDTMLNTIIRQYSNNKTGVITYLKQNDKELILCDDRPVGEISRWINNTSIYLYKN